MKPWPTWSPAHSSGAKLVEDRQHLVGVVAQPSDELVLGDLAVLLGALVDEAGHVTQRLRLDRLPPVRASSNAGR